MSRANMLLFFNDLEVGTVRDCFLSDDVWYGDFSLSGELESELTRRVREFISFCELWNERVQGDRGADASEFDAFLDVVYDGCWVARSCDGQRVIEIENAPVFVLGGEVSFRAKE